ncbi:MAG: M28 family peptidase [Chloroflexi bacterium]|nr:M28 family peptidase [Chloroflexota bacterium]
MSDIALAHVKHFTEVIGPRGSTTADERQAHEYCKQTLEGLGYETHWEEHYACVSAWLTYAVAIGAMMLATALFFFAGRGPNASAGALGASAIGLVVVASFFLNISHLDNPLRWFVPSAKSQNVWVAAQPTGEVKRRVVVSGHVDTHRTALAMQSVTLWRVFQALTSALGVAQLVLLGLFVYGIFNTDPLLRTIAAALNLLLVAALVFTVQPDTTPYVKGANDNATGAAGVLALAERLKREPLTHTQVFLVNTGTEEVDCYGMADWLKRHAQAEAADADYLVLDNIGGKNSDVNYVLSETLLTPLRSDPGLVALADAVAKEHPELEAKPWHYKGLSSEVSMCAVHKQRVLGLLNFDPKSGMPPNFHTVRDDFSNVDPDVLDRSERFAWEILQKLDAS